MKFTLKSKLTLSFILVAALTLAFSSLLFYRFWLDYAVKSKKAELLRQGQVLADSFANNKIGTERIQLVDRLIRYSAAITGARVIILGPAGRVIADTAESVPQNGPGGRIIPPLPPRLLKQNDPSMAFAVMPIKDGRGGSVVLFSPIRDIQRAQWPAFKVFFISGIVSFIIASLAGLYLAFGLTRPLEKLKVAVKNMGRGQFLQKVPVEASDEIGELVSTFNMMSSRVDKAYSLQQEFASNVSHELKTPLTSIEGFSKILLDGQVQDREQGRKYLKIINTESKRITKIVNDLLALARIDMGSFKPQVSELEASTVLTNISEKFGPLASDKGVTLNFMQSDIRFVNDIALVEQIIGNLVENAIKYTDEGGTIGISAEQNGANVCFRVKDSGVGISLEDQRKIFNRFYRADKSDKSSGAGLGLSICQALVKRLGGTIKVTSTPAEGTEFSVYLPKNS